MEPQNLNFGGGVADTVVNPFVLAVVLLAGVLICILPRRKVIIPFLAIGILVPINQILMVGGLHFQMLRVLALFGFARLAWTKFSGREEIFSGGMNGIDKAVIVLTVFSAIDGMVLWTLWGEVVFQLGNLYTVFGVYFLLRYLIRDAEDVRHALQTLTYVVVFVAVIMTYEHFTGKNVYYAMLGGANVEMFSKAIDRADIFRARGCFAHPILAGTFGGFMAPLFIGWWMRDRKCRNYAALGALGATLISFSVGSSTALFAYLAGIGALCLWPMRGNMRLLRWGVVGVLVAGQLYMKSPVWHIISDVSLSDGSSSYHRYQLVNQCIRHFWDWVLIGTKDYASWGFDMWDLSNQYVATADTVGLIPLMALLAILVFGFKYLGRARRIAENEGDKEQERFLWAIGASLFANLAAFFGISYFDQIIVPWYALLAIICAMTLVARVPQLASEPVVLTGASARLRPINVPAWKRIGAPLQNFQIRGARPRVLVPGMFKHRKDGD
jgi:hypothetical protein